MACALDVISSWLNRSERDCRSTSPAWGEFFFSFLTNVLKQHKTTLFHFCMLMRFAKDIWPDRASLVGDTLRDCVVQSRSHALGGGRHMTNPGQHFVAVIGGAISGS